MRQWLGLVVVGLLLGCGGLLSPVVAEWEKACEGGLADGCKNLGGLYATGQGLHQDDAKAAELWGKACDLGFEPACDALKDL